MYCRFLGTNLVVYPKVQRSFGNLAGPEPEYSAQVKRSCQFEFLWGFGRINWPT